METLVLILVFVLVTLFGAALTAGLFAGRARYLLSKRALIGQLLVIVSAVAVTKLIDLWLLSTPVTYTVIAICTAAIVILQMLSVHRATK